MCVCGGNSTDKIWASALIYLYPKKGYGKWFSSGGYAVDRRTASRSSCRSYHNQQLAFIWARNTGPSTDCPFLQKIKQINSKGSFGYSVWVHLVLGENTCTRSSPAGAAAFSSCPQLPFSTGHPTQHPPVVSTGTRWTTGKSCVCVEDVSWSLWGNRQLSSVPTGL